MREDPKFVSQVWPRIPGLGFMTAAKSHDIGIEGNLSYFLGLIPK
jgi:hypothetical protein